MDDLMAGSQATKRSCLREKTYGAEVCADVEACDSDVGRTAEEVGGECLDAVAH